MRSGVRLSTAPERPLRSPASRRREMARRVRSRGFAGWPASGEGSARPLALGICVIRDVRSRDKGQCIRCR